MTDTLKRLCNALLSRGAMVNTHVFDLLVQLIEEEARSRYSTQYGKLLADELRGKTEVVVFPHGIFHRFKAGMQYDI